jgi:hypothetical protein
MGTLNNFNAIALASEARTATTTVDLHNSSGKGCHVIIDMTAVTATGSVTPTIQGLDKASGKYYTLLVGAAITGTGTTVLRVYPDLTAAANLIADDIVPGEFRISLAHANAVAMTYSVGVNIV